jgi:hypothetical protein
MVGFGKSGRKSAFLVKIKTACPNLKLWGSLVMLCAVSVSGFPHELMLMGGMDTSAPDKTVTAPPIRFNSTENSIIGNVRLSGDFAKNISYGFEAGLDSIWRYYLMGEAAFRFGFLKLGVGTFFQYSEIGTEFLNPAVIANVGIEFPGIFFMDGKAFLLPYEDLSKTGNFGYSYAALSVGYWTQNLIAGLSFDYKKFEEKRTDDLLAKDTLTRYFVHAGIYDKNRMFTTYLDFGYETLTAEISGAAAESILIQAFFVDVEFKIQLASGIAWHIRGGSPFVAADTLLGILFKATTGISIRLAD